MEEENSLSNNYLAISVILPTFNRMKVLELVLTSLERQTASKKKFEVIVSDDGSSDGTQDFLRQYAKITACRFQFVLAEKNNGPAKARNLALYQAKGTIIIIIGDDIEVNEEFVQQHLDWHTTHNAIGDAVLGYVTWPESIKPNNFMRWLETGGRYFFFPYADFQSGHTVDCQNFYTCNISIKRSLLYSTNLFDESFPYASHEDIELGERLRLEGMTLYYEQSIQGYHHHFLHIEGIAKRVYLMGYSAHIYWQKVADRSSQSKKSLRFLLRHLFLLPGIWSLLVQLLKIPAGKKSNTPFRWKLILIMSYWLGIADAGCGRKARIFPVV